MVASDRSSSGRATVNWTELTSQSEGRLSPNQSRHRGRFRVMAGAGSGWRRGGSLHRKRPTDGKGKAAPSGARKWLVGLRFSAIRSEGADGSRGIFFKEFNAPTAIHWLPPRASDHEHLRRRLPCEPRPHRGGDRGAKRPTSFELTAEKAMRSAADDDAARLRQAENERLQLGRWRRAWRGWRGQ
jgi:hypothetical protein